MKKEPVDLAQLADTLEALRREVARLSERVAMLEAGGKGQESGVRSQESAQESGVRDQGSGKGPSSLTPDP
jgi:hypothetical protein